MTTTTSGMRISEVTAETGFTGPTLRYYEQIGLLPPPARTDAGYRLYNDRDVDRLTFIARAKRLGCSLDEIRGLAQAWDQDRCGPVQHRLRSLVGAKVAGAETQMADLRAFTADLRAAATQLAQEPVDGACDDSCACVAVSPTVMREPVTVEMGAKPVLVPIACTLGGDDMTVRLEDWKQMLATVTDRTPIKGGLRLTFEQTTSVADLARLVVAEQSCCSFLSFAITVDHRGVALEVTSPPDGMDVLDMAFGAHR